VEIVNWLQNNDQGLFLFLISFANAIFLPIGPEVALFPMLLVDQAKLVPYASCCVAGSVLGLMVTYFISYYCGQTVIVRYVSANKIKKSVALFSRYGYLALVVASVFPIFPYRIMVILSGFLKQKPPAVFFYLTLGKTIRFFGYGFLIAKMGESVLKYLY